METAQNFSEVSQSEYSRPAITQDEIEEAKKVFDSLDIDGVGYIDPIKLRSSIQSLGFTQSNQIVYKMVSELENRFTRPIVLEYL